MSAPVHAGTHIRRLGPDDVATLQSLNAVFADAFDDHAHYASQPPSTEYLQRLLGRDSFFALAATISDEVVGGLVAYELQKFEQECTEIYLYDLAVAVEHRRGGIATQLIRELQKQARLAGASSLYVQADQEDEPAIALYTSLGSRADVLHFDIAL